MINQPVVKLGIVGVSRDCFPASLTKARLAALMAEVKKAALPEVYDCPVVIENDVDTYKALDWAKANGINAVCMFLGNFGPEGPTTLFVQKFDGPAMVIAAKEEGKANLANDRGDALCGVLNFSYNVGLRRLKVYIPEYPNVTPEEGVKELADFRNIARVVIGVKNLKVIGFGPRPWDFLACNAPIQPMYDLGIEVQENSELDLYKAFNEITSKAGKQAEIEAVAKDMEAELGKGNNSKFAVFANKCWPAWQPIFEFEPCYVNSRLTGRGIPVACEVDLYGALSEFMAECATEKPATLLDINNSVPADVIPAGANLAGADLKDLYMGFHCGNTCSSCMKSCEIKYQLIQARLMSPDITKGTLEGQIAPGKSTMFRIQSNSDSKLVSYIAQGEFLDVDPCSFGGIGIHAIPGFARFYRHVLVGKRFPHHGAYAFDHCGKVLFEALRLLGVEDINTPLPAGQLYPGENPFAI